MYKDLHFITKYLQEFITQNELLASYKQLSTDFTASKTATEADVDTIEMRIKEMQAKIYQAHENVNFHLLSPAQMETLKQMKALPVIGTSAIKRLDVAFARSTNPLAVTEVLTQLTTETTALEQRVARAIEDFSLSDFVQAVEEKSGYVEIIFDDGAGFKNFWEVEDRAREWRFIIQALAELSGENFEDIETIAWNSGCPQVGVWIKGGITFIEAIKTFGKVVTTLKQLKDSIIGKKEAAKDLGAGSESLKAFQEDIERNVLGIYKEKKTTATVELKRTFGKNSTRPDGDGNNFLEIAFEKAVQQLADGVRIVDPDEVTPSPVIVKHSDGSLPEPTMGELYRKQFEQNKELEKYIEAETQKRLEARAEQMKKDLGVVEKKEDLTVVQLKEKLEEAGEDTRGSRKELLERFLKLSMNATEEQKAEESTVPSQIENPKK